MDGINNIDPELKPIVEAMPRQVFTRENLAQMRETSTANRAAMELPETTVSVSQRVISNNGHEVNIHVYTPEGAGAENPGLLWFHGGGYIVGSSDDFQALLIAEACRCTVVSVDYSIAPEHPFPAGTDDGYFALEWLFENAADLNISSRHIAIGGASAGAGMAAGVSLMNRDRKNLPLVFQFLLYPMLDNLHDTDSGKIENHAIWCRESSLNAWEMYLDGVPGIDASPYAAASRATDLSGLPSTYIAVGTQDLFRDEDIYFAQRLMAADVPTKLEVFPGIFHGADAYFRNTKAGKNMTNSYYSALKLGLMESA